MMLLEQENSQKYASEDNVLQMEGQALEHLLRAAQGAALPLG